MRARTSRYNACGLLATYVASENPLHKLTAELMTIDEAATYLNVPARWVADAVRQRKVRCTRIGKHIRFRIEHLDELVAAGEQPVTSDVIPIQRNRTRSKL